MVELLYCCIYKEEIISVSIMTVFGTPQQANKNDINDELRKFGSYNYVLGALYSTILVSS